MFVSEVYRISWPGTPHLYAWRLRSIGGQVVLSSKEWFRSFDSARTDVGEKVENIMEARGWL